jgi:hypothetical protein
MPDDPELLPVDDDLDPEVFLRTRTIDNVTVSIQGLLDAMRNDGMNPVRALRLIETLATTTRDQLAELGTPEEPTNRRRRNGGLGAVDYAMPRLGGGHAQETVIVDEAMAFMRDMGEQTRGEFHTRRIRNMTEALSNAKQMKDDDLVTKLRGKLDALLGDDAVEEEVPNNGVLGAALADDFRTVKGVFDTRTTIPSMQPEQPELPLGAPA